MALLYQVGYWVIAVSAVVFAVFVFQKNPKSSIHVTWALLNLAIAVWAALTDLYWFEPNDDRALLLCRISLYAAALIPIFFAHFCLRFTDRILRNNVPVMVGYLFSLVLAGFVLTPAFVPHVSSKLFFPHYTDPGPLFVVFTAEFFILIAYGEYLLFSSHAHLSANRQGQVRYVAIGLFIAFSCGGTCFLLVYGIPLSPWPSLLIPIYHLFISYAIVRHQFMDIRIVIRKSLIYSIIH